MTRASAILKGGLKLGLGQVVTQSCSFLRSVIVARLISPEDYGIAALFATILSMLEMLSNIAASSLLIQAPDGDEPGFQRTAHLVSAGRGFWNAVLFLLLAGPASNLFGVPHAAWAFRWMAAIPLLRGLVHLDASRFQRGLRFGPTVFVDVGSNIFATLLVLPLAIWLKDYSAMLWILILQSVGTTLASHLVGERRYAWAWERRYVRRIFTFGWPLLVNGLLMYGIMEGDRVIIGSAGRLFAHSKYTLTDLGIYSVAFALTMAPTNFVASVTTSLFLPILSHVKDVEMHFRRRYLACLHVVLLAAATISIPFVFAGGRFVTGVYGPKYAAAGGVIGWLAVMWGIRILRVAPTLAAMARGDTKSAMLSNIGRSLAGAGMLIAAATGSDIVWISISGFGGECIALGISAWRLHRLHRIPLMVHVKPLCLVGLGLLIAAVAKRACGSFGIVYATAGSVLLVLIAVSAMMLLLPDLNCNFQVLASMVGVNQQPKTTMVEGEA